MIVKYNELRELAELTTNAKGVSIKDGNIDTLIKLCINRVYEEFELYKKYDYIIESEYDKIYYDLPEDFIRPVKFFGQDGTRYTYNDENGGFIFYDGSQTLEVRFTDFPTDAIHIHYVAYPEVFCDDMPVFSYKYLETFSTYMNFVLHRMVGFKDLNTLGISKSEYEYEKQRIEDKGFNTDTIGDIDKRASEKGFVL